MVEWKYLESLPLNLENSRNCLRRIARHDETEFSNQSILNMMEKFVKSVNAMDETILVPCRLMDLKVGDAQDITDDSKKHGTPKIKSNVKDTLISADLFDLFNMLNTVKVDLLWGQNNSQCASELPQLQPQVQSQPQTQLTSTTISISTSTSTTINSPNTLGTKGHVRRPSTVSMTSTNSVVSAISDSESEAGGENDSGIEAEDASISTEGAPASHNPTQVVADNFRRHLIGLYRSLQQLTDAANYLTTRYQHDVGSHV